MDAIYVLYMHTRASDGGIFYIGIGDIKRPFDTWKRSKFWNHIVNKHGYNVQIIAENLTWENACDLEKKYIAFYGRRDKNQGCLVNLTDGGDGACGVIVSEETRKKIGEARKGKKHLEESRKKMSQATKGKKHSEEIRKKIGEAMKGRKLSEESRKKMSEAKKGKVTWNKGKKLSEEIRKKLSEANKGKKHSEESRKKISKSLKGRPSHWKGKKHLEETRKKMSEVLKICWIKRKQAQNQLPLINFNYANA